MWTMHVLIGVIMTVGLINHKEPHQSDVYNMGSAAQSGCVEVTCGSPHFSSISFSVNARTLAGSASIEEADHCTTLFTSV